MSYPRYQTYKNSGVPWLGQVPAHWGAKQLRRVVDVRPSNVDKLTIEGQQLVQLCNYMDVYKNEKITNSLEFMGASAPEEQIRRLTIQRNDVIITKDSETPDDIGVAALVDQQLENVVCGYHLSLLRPQLDTIHGSYLFRSLQSSFCRAQFSVSAVGMTRYGLSLDDIKSVVVPLPPLDEQCSIAAFLDRETAQIDALVSKQQQISALLQEKRHALISGALTRGLNPNAPLKDSGIELLGKKPAHWTTGRLKYFVSFMDSRRVPISSEERGGRTGDFPYYGASGIIDYIDNYIFDEPLVLVAEDGANLLNRSTPIAFVATGKYWVNNHAHILKPTDDLVDYWAHLIESIDVAPYVTGSAQPKLTIEALANLPVAVPPTVDERSQIITHIQSQCVEIDQLCAVIRKTVDMLSERRAALITAAVTGQIDVRGSTN